MIALNSPTLSIELPVRSITEGTPMSAEITITSEVIETRVIDNKTGNTIETRYFDRMDDAINSIEDRNITSLDIIQENF